MYYPIRRFSRSLNYQPSAIDLPMHKPHIFVVLFLTLDSHVLYDGGHLRSIKKTDES